MHHLTNLWFIFVLCLLIASTVKLETTHSRLLRGSNRKQHFATKNGLKVTHHLRATQSDVTYLTPTRTKIVGVTATNPWELYILSATVNGGSLDGFDYPGTSCVFESPTHDSQKHIIYTNYGVDMVAMVLIEISLTGSDVYASAITAGDYSDGHVSDCDAALFVWGESATGPPATSPSMNGYGVHSLVLGGAITHDTAVPTLSPTEVPTQTPTATPTDHPTERPTGMPSSQPSADPTSAPSEAPSATPSGRPSSVPSGQPSEQPSNQPTCSPSIQPTSQPSANPSLMPTVQPSSLPSCQPSVQPTAVPSVQPSDAPTQQPTNLPSSQPTSDPSCQPSGAPSVPPTVVPSSQPSDNPSSQPTVVPSSDPSAQPSGVPSRWPAAAPSAQPRAKPSAIPSSEPSATPTLHASGEPSSQPSGSPSSQPSTAPSAQPSGRPSHCPSGQPTASPSRRPSALPTIMPSFYLGGGSLPGNYTLSIMSDTSQIKIVLPFYLLLDSGKGNGYDDVTVAAPKFGINTVVFGGTSSTSWTAPRDLRFAAETGAGFQFKPAIGIDFSGRSMANAGDINGDGFDDFIIGVPRVSTVYVMFGTASGHRNMSNGFEIYDNKTDFVGWSVSGAGDVNGDSLRDFLIGAPGQRGAVFVIYGRASDIKNIDLNKLEPWQGYKIVGEHATDYLGLSVSNAGDVNGDGYDDIVVGAVLMNDNSRGAAYVIYGQAALVESPMTLKDINGTKGMVVMGSAWSWLGYSVSAAGDFNGDGFADILIGCPSNLGLGTGASYIVFGGSTGGGRPPIDADSMNATQGVKISGGGGVVSAVGDVNGDGFDDVMIGSDYGDSGAGYVVYLPVSILTPTAAPTASLTTKPSAAGPVDSSTTPSRQPTPVISVRPSKVNDTNPPTVLATTQPTPEPSSGGSPTARPISVSTTVPTARASLLPTRVITVAPVTQSSSPTMQPVRPPLPRPTVAPTTAPSYNGTMEISIGGVYEIGPDITMCIINTTGTVTIHVTAMVANVSRVFVVIPHSSGLTNITSFSVSLDVIDLQLFTAIRGLRQLNLTAGSTGSGVIVDLLVGQKLILNDLALVDVTEDNFKFFSSLDICLACIYEGGQCFRRVVEWLTPVNRVHVDDRRLLCVIHDRVQEVVERGSEVGQHHRDDEKSSSDEDSADLSSISNSADYSSISSDKSQKSVSSATAANNKDGNLIIERHNDCGSTKVKETIRVMTIVELVTNNTTTGQWTNESSG